ncbi:hypothetical protein HBI81_171820 [Parastagonospora nodorum]|nr:hypothetical protein HBI03_002120 [Parastagonospora nodorum]KAH4276109.1 hypothetical protein HBI04_117990 [Parastagonospora nodorum]KAH4411687.1 hypothetical protein HBH92_116970 [Parastagonospora nodorum]KAH4425687.1 hypothetical protein HBH93_177450 [Parastagonospora nodorum]KAH4443702.1 hypothetical protein HBH91_159030 [Parastagonospora nodorum]
MQMITGQHWKLALSMQLSILHEKNGAVEWLGLNYKGDERFENPHAFRSSREPVRPVSMSAKSLLSLFYRTVAQ